MVNKKIIITRMPFLKAHDSSSENEREFLKVSLE